MALRNLLRDRRIALGWSTYKVVARAHALAPDLKGFHQSALLSWEADVLTRSPSAEQLDVWARILGMRLELVDEDAQFEIDAHQAPRVMGRAA